ncbi:MAG: hypothetical protein LBI62_06335 [Candidatus Accumulibacter sp.]|jgi:hypothetical protein|nr:hypothetical protein [Accumulibacter sp.]
MKNGQPSVRGTMDFHLGLHIMTAVTVDRYLEREISEARAIIMTRHTFELLAQNVIQLTTPVHGTKVQPSSRAQSAYLKVFFGSIL